MNSQKQTVSRSAPARGVTRTSDDANLPDRLSGVATDLEFAIERGDLGAIVEATRGLRRLEMDVQDGRFATRG